MRDEGREAVLGEAGHTLLELMVVLAILAVVGALSMRLALGPPAGVSLTAAAQSVVTEARLARLLALQQNQDTVLMLDVDTSAMWVEGRGKVKPIPSDIVLKLTTAAPERRSQTIGGIRFFADGTSTGGEVLLSRAGQSRTVRIDWLIGRASVLDE